MKEEVEESEVEVVMGEARRVAAESKEMAVRSETEVRMATAVQAVEVMEEADKVGAKAEGQVVTREV